MRSRFSVLLVSLLALGPQFVLATPIAHADGAVLTSRFVALPPTRVLDTRKGLGAPAARPAQSSVVTLALAGVGGVPASGASAVVLNLTATEGARAGYVQALPGDAGVLGGSSNINLMSAGQTVANLATVPLDSIGTIRLYDVAGAHLIADVLGYFTESGASAAGRYQALTPARILDSRSGLGMPVLPPPPPPPPTKPPNPGDTKNCSDFATWAQANAWYQKYFPYYGDVAKLDRDHDGIPCEDLPGAPKTATAAPAARHTAAYPKPAARAVIHLQVTGSGGVPATGVSAVVLNLVATQSTGPGYLQVFPTGSATALGSSSNVNVSAANQTVANLVVVPVGTGGRVDIYVASGSHVVADVSGYYTDGTSDLSTSGLFVPIAPTRFLDTRHTVKPTAGSQTVVNSATAAGVPATGVSAVMMNLTVTQTGGGGYAQLFPTGQGTPGASSALNFATAGATVSNPAVASLGAGGDLTAFLTVAAQLVMDAVGYFTDANYVPPPPPTNPILSGLVIADKIPDPAYNPDDWHAWIDADGNCLDTRAEVLLARSATPAVMSTDGCTVVSGTWTDPYSGTVYTAASELDIDHTVPLKNADESGAADWSIDRKTAYANDLTDHDHLLPVASTLDESKGDSGPEDWKPPAVSDWCTYATDWATIKKTWSLTVTQAEYDALTNMLSAC